MKVKLMSSLVLCGFLTGWFATNGLAETEGVQALQTVIASEHRSADNKARDIYRHPKETLEFFEVAANMTVVEIWPGAGWYTEILAPYLSEHGKLYAAHFSPKLNVKFYQQMLADFQNKLTAKPEIYGKVVVTAFNPPNEVEIAPAGTVDRVLTFRNFHNWMVRGEELNAFKSIFAALKPGGLLGVVEHRGPMGQPQDSKASSGYVSEDYVVAVAEKAGFKLLGKSEINANPKDTKDYPKGVWTLPPRLILGEQNKAKYLEIGESDRMTLKFQKPE